MDSYVVKVQNKGSIRRLTLSGGEKVFSFEQLQSRIRELFQLPAAAQFGLTYVDKDGDVVTMGEDEDLRDALVLQALNPLRVTIENAQEGGSDDGVKTSAPILQKEANSVEVTEKEQSIQGKEIPPIQSQSGVDAVAAAEPVSVSGKNSTLDDEKASTIDGASDSNRADGPPAGPGADVAAKDVSPEAGTTGNETQGAEVPKENLERLIHVGIKCDDCGMNPIQGSRFQSLTKSNYDLCRQCFEASDAVDYEYAEYAGVEARSVYPERMRRRPARGMWRNPHPRPSATPDSAPKNGTSGGAPGVPQGGDKSAADNSTRVLHQGVQCDECGVVPIEGARFNSYTTYNYDLCHSCYEKSGSNASEYRRIERPFFRRGQPLVFMPMSRLASPRLRQSPLCRRWVMVPNQIFPILAGHPAAAPAGAAEEKTSVAAGSDVKVSGYSVDTRQAESAATEGTSSATPAAQVDADATTTSASKQGLGTTEDGVMDSKARGNVVEIPVAFSSEEADTETPAGGETVPSKENGTADISGKTAGIEETNVPSSVAGESSTKAGESSTKEDLAAKLATMGFEDSTLNAELLEKNNFDLRKTVDDLCAAEEWDPILGELQEMGFYDANMNRRLLFKNNGSVKRVVKELVQMYKGKNA